MKNNRRIQALLALFICAVSLLKAQGQAIPLDPGVRTGKLPNGMTYYIRKNAEPKNRAELRLAVNAGSVLERDDQQGLAHFCEHMAFNGSTHFKKSELVDYLESIGTKFGAHLNAYTSFDETVYMLQVPTDDQAIMDKALTVLEDWAHGVSFDPAEIDKERGVVIEEWRLGQGADERMSKKYLPVLFYNSRYAERLPIGKKDILETFPHKVLTEFYNAWYRPDLMAVIAVGDFDLDQMEKTIKERFGKIPAKNGPARTQYTLPDHQETLVAVEKDKEATYSAAQVMFKFAYSAPKTEDDYRQVAMRQIITSMLTSRLQEYTTKENAPFNFAFSGEFPLSSDKTALLVIGITSPDKSKSAMETLLLEGERATRHGFLPAELERAKAKWMSELESQLREKDKTQSSDHAMQLVDLFLNANPVPGIEWEKAMADKIVAGITVEELNQLVKNIITDKNRVIILTGQEKDGVNYPSKDEITTLASDVHTRTIEPYKEEVDNAPLVGTPTKPGKVTAVNKIEGTSIEEWTLSNGAKVVILPTDFKEDEILLHAVSPGGSSRYGDKDYFSADMAGQISSMSGAGRLSRAKLDKKMAGKIVECNPYLDDYREGISGSCAVKDLETLLQMVHVTFTNPRIDKEGFAAFQSMMRTQTAMSASPEGAMSDSLTLALYNNHPRRQPLSESVISKINQQKAFEVLIDRFGDASDFTFIFVGNINAEKDKAMIETWLGSLPGMARKENWKDVGIRFASGKVEKTVYKGSEPKAMVEMHFTGTMEYTAQNSYNLKAMKDVLNIMLRETLREEKGGTYGVRIYSVADNIPAPYYEVVISFGCAPENAQPLTEAAMAQIKALAENGPSEKNLQKVQETHRRSWEADQRDNNFWMQQMVKAYTHASSPAEIMQYPKLVEGLNADAVKAAAKQYMNLNNYVKVVLMPEAR